MTQYVVIYQDSDGEMQMVQGTVQQINAELSLGDETADSFLYRDAYMVFTIDNNKLIREHDIEFVSVPQLRVG